MNSVRSLSPRSAKLPTLAYIGGLCVQMTREELFRRLDRYFLEINIYEGMDILEAFKIIRA